MGSRGGRKKKKRENENGFEQWGNYMEAKKQKLMEQFNSDALRNIETISNLFKGVAIYVNGHTRPSAEDLKILMAEHGGVYHTYQCAATTHIIASNLPNVKINKLGNLPIVKPGWIEDSITLGRILDFSSYLLYTNQSRSQPRLNFYMKAKTDESEETNKREMKNEASNSEEIQVDELTENDEKLETDEVEIETEKKIALPSTQEIDDMNNLEEMENEAQNICKPELGRNEPKQTKTASDPKFLAEFYNNSRLHLISTLGAEMKQHVNDMRDRSDLKFPALVSLCNTLKNVEKKFEYNSDSIIMHIDMDCFFVSVGLRKRPELRGIPVAVTHSRGGNSGPSNRTGGDVAKEAELYAKRHNYATTRLIDLDSGSSLSEIASCSYEARRCGIKNGMFMGAALKLCPDLVAIPYDFEGYREVSAELYRTIACYTLDIEAVSCDEMYVDVSKVLSTANVAVEQWASYVRNEITTKTGCPCSTGFGANRLQARMATKRAKPNGQYYLKPQEVSEYFATTPLRDLPGVGRATLQKLMGLSLETCGDIQQSSLAVIQKELGAKIGETIWDQAQGIDRKPLQFQHERKSVSAEVNYGIRFQNEDEAINFLKSLSEEVRSRLVDTGMKAKCVTLKIMVRAEEAPVETAKYLGHGVCDSLSRSSTLGSTTNDINTIFTEAKNLYKKLNLSFKELRGVGIQLSRLEKVAKVNEVMANFLASTSNKATTSTNTEVLEPKPTKTSPETVSKRGRPKGSKNIIQRTNSNDLSNYFKNQKIENNSKKLLENIDMQVLKELPVELRQEIMKEYNMDETPQTSSRNLVSSVDPKPIQPKKSVKIDAQEQIEKAAEQKSSKERERTNFHDLSHEKFKSMLKRWINSTENPLEYDARMLGKHFKEMAVDRKIEMLQVYMKFIHRKLEEKNCNWHDAYFQLLNYVQEGMIMRYGNTMLVPRCFTCDKHFE